jgi:hypothetical protein
MLDLAPALVAEDKAVNDTMEKSQQSHETTRVIQIANGAVYAQTHLACKEYGNAGHQWAVIFPSEQESSSSSPPPLSLLREIEINMGHESKIILNTTNNLIGGYLVPDPRDYDNGKVVKIFSSDATTSLWVSVMIHGWPKAHWEAVINQGLQADGRDAMHYIYGDLAVESPQKTFTFLEMTFVLVEDFMDSMIDLDDRWCANASRQRQ